MYKTHTRYHYMNRLIYKKLTRPNFSDLYCNVRIVLKQERILYFLKNLIPPAMMRILMKKLGIHQRYINEHD